MKTEEQVRALLKEEEGNLREYLSAGGSDSAYLEGKINAYKEVLGEPV